MAEKQKTSGKPFVLGILGGMGTYATIHVFQQYAETFPAEKEWERPRVLIDNNCTMPSRVRATLYDENRPQLVSEMTSSLCHLMEAGATHIILACNTSHLFLDEIYQLAPQAKERVVNIIDICVDQLVREGSTDVYLLATEGTILSNVYGQKLAQHGIRCHTPTEQEFGDLRKCIEAVKQHKYTEEVMTLFKNFLRKDMPCILGCTELPILYARCYAEVEFAMQIYDPIALTLDKIRREYLSDTGGPK